jgi:YHYH protein/Cupredoxin-like domain
MHALLLGLLAVLPVDRVWIRTPAQFTGDIAPEVQSLELTRDAVTVRSAGVSLGYLGPLQASPQPPDSVRRFTFRIPRNPRAAAGRHAHVPPDAMGVFVNGLPVYNQFEAISYQGQNLWHFDAVAMRLKGEAPRGLLEALVVDGGKEGGKHSPIIGYALDGYPIYGPWGFTAGGALHRMRSSYRLRNITERTCWPDGTVLAPGQYGPRVTAEFPLGTFAEDYEYAEGGGDLDRYNGRFTRTPEYPQGTYAYFLTFDSAERLAFPYLLASEYRGVVEMPASNTADSIASRGGITLRTSKLAAGQPAALRLEMPSRFLEYVHERPIHMMIVSADLRGFDHVHPELTAAGDWEVNYTFPRGGKHRVYVEFTPPGGGARLEFFDVNVAGDAPAPPPARPHVGVTLSALTLRAGEDLELRFTLTHAETLEPYLGAWAHFAVVDAGFSTFIHAHPLGNIPEPMVHTHGAVTGPPPSELHTVVSFPKAGLYKLWAQFQVAGKVETVPFVLHVQERLAKAVRTVMTPPKDAIHIHITAGGYEPARIETVGGAPVKLWFTRTGEPNCGARVVVPSLGIAREVPLGGSALVEIPAPPSGEIRFTCGMGMYRGMIVVH